MSIDLKNMAVLAEATSPDGTVVRVLEFPNLKGSDDPSIAEALFFAQQAGMTAKLVEITLKDGACTLEPGALYFMKGNLTLSTGTGGGLLGGLGRAILGGETVILNTIKGTGVVYLEPTFGHVMLHEIKSEEKAVVADRGSFYASTGGIRPTATRVRSLGGMALGGEGLFQTRIEGVGIAILTCPVPESEIAIAKLVPGEVLQVDGSFAILRSVGVEFSVTKSSKSWLGTAFSGEGLLNSYKGQGRVWLAPTQGVYQRIRTFGSLSSSAATGKGRDSDGTPAR